MKPTTVPINLGCCPEPRSARCVLCNGVNDVDGSVVAALIDEYRSDGPLLVRYFGGPPPSDALLAPATGMPKAVRVRPDLLTRDDARRLIDAGVGSFELDVLSFSGHALRRSGRRYRAALVEEIAQGLAQMGARVGVVLAPGLPGSDRGSALADARQATAWADFARIHPVLVLHGTELAERLHAERYLPLTIEEAVDVCREMLDILEGAGVEVIRIGQQPRPDGLARAIAGPAHPSFRQLVEGKRALDRLRGLLDGTAVASHVVIHCAPADETRTRGPSNEHLRILRREYDLQTVKVQVDPSMPRGRWVVAAPKESA